MGTSVEVAANLCINELFPRMERLGIEVEDSPTELIAYLAHLKSRGEIDTHSIRQILDRYFDTAG